MIVKAPWPGPRVRFRMPRAARVTGIFLLALVAASGAFAARTEEPPPDNTVFLSRIIINGNHYVSTKELRSRMRTREPSMFSFFSRPRLNRAQLQRDVVQLEAYYHSIGFPEATVKLERIVYLEKNRFANVYIQVDEGVPTRVGSVTFTGQLLMEPSVLREGLLLKPGSPYNPSLLDTDIYKIKGKYFDRGYLGVAVQDSVHLEAHTADIRFQIEPGTQLRVGQITVEGNRMVRRGVIDAEITLKPGDICRFSKVLKTQRNLFETGLFTVVDVVPENIDPVKRTVDLRIRLRERKGSWVEAGFGVGNVLGSRVFAEWGTRNLAGTGRTLRFKAQYAFDLFEGNEVDFNHIHLTSTFYRYDAVYQQRRVFGIKVGMGLNAYVERDATVQNLDVRTIGYAIGTTHEFSRYSEILGGLSFEEITRRQTGLPDEKSNSHSVGATVSRDTRDFLLDAHHGGYRYVSSEVAGGILGGDNDYYKLTGNDQRYHGIGAGSVLAWRGRVGFADTYGRSSEVPVESRYFLGGANSVRGYKESSLGRHYSDATGTDRVAGGQFVLLANAEARFPIPLLWRWHFSGAAFVDAGNVWDKATDVRWSDFRLTSDASETKATDMRYGIGLGVRYNTPVGPIRLDFGYPLKPDASTAPHGTWYLSLGQIF